MKINYQYQNPNFTSIYRANATVMKRMSFKKYMPQDMFIKELCPEISNDETTLNELIDLWDQKTTINGYGAGFARDIKYEFNKLVPIYNNILPANNAIKSKFYVIEEDNKNKEEFENILGIMQFNETKTLRNAIKWLQIDPELEYQHKRYGRKYKGIGKSLVEFVQKISTKPIEVLSADDAVKFYEKMGFHKAFDTSSIFLIYDRDTEVQQNNK